MSAVDVTDASAPETNLLPGLIQRPPELGRIRLGEKTETGAPRRLTTFRFTSASKATLEAAAALYGGTVRKWEGAPDEGMWELKTTVAELDIFIPSSLSVIGQSYEYWQGGTCERRCDGITETASGEPQPCLCAAAGLTGAERPCDIVTRLRVILPRVPGLGIWRLDTSGYLAATTLPSTINLLARLTPGAWIPAILRAAQRSTRVRDDKGKVVTHRFVVPEIDLPGVTIGAIVGGSSPALLDEGERPKPPTAAERVAQKRAELEAQAEAGDGHPAANAPVGGDPAIPTPAPALPLPRGQCTVASPREDDCRLGLGHDGDHVAGNKRWPTPSQQQAPSSGHADEAIERAPASDGEARQDAGAEVRATASAPDVTAEASEIFDGDFVDAPDDVPPDVQAGLDLIPANHTREGR